MSDQRTIVIIEDDAFIGKIYNNKLNSSGYNAIVSSNWEEGVKAIKEQGAKLVLLDIIMPDKNGFEVLEGLKADPATKDIPVIMLSNLGQQEDIDKTKELGAVDYLVKANLSLEEVVNKIREHIV